MSGAPPILFDAALRTRRQWAATCRGGEFLWGEAGEGIAARLVGVVRTFETALAVDGRAPIVLPRPSGWELASFDAQEQLTQSPPADLAVSILSLHALNDLPGALRQIRLRLRPGGLFMAAVLGGQTAIEVRDSFAAADAAMGGAVRRIAPFADIRDWGRVLMRAGFAMPVADVERSVVRYSNAARLIADMRAMGELGILARPRPALSRGGLAAASAHYATHHADTDGKLRATFDIVYLIGWAIETDTLRSKLAPKRD